MREWSPAAAQHPEVEELAWLDGAKAVLVSERGTDLVLSNHSAAPISRQPIQQLPSRGYHPIGDKIMLKWSDVLNLAKNGNPAPERKVVKTDAEWRRQLTPEEYHVTRQAGTERAFSSQMCGLFEPGIYSCLCCESVLFDASEKFESGTGWPSFTQPLAINAIAYRFDGPAFLKRVETICNTCDAHLGHVFPDGPEPSGLRYCMNAVALKKTSSH